MTSADVKIIVRVAQEEYDAMQELATANNLLLSEWVRKALIAYGAPLQERKRGGKRVGQGRPKKSSNTE
jgi:hypothetical protein